MYLDIMSHVRSSMDLLGGKKAQQQEHTQIPLLSAELRPPGAYLEAVVLMANQQPLCCRTVRQQDAL